MSLRPLASVTLLLAIGLGALGCKSSADAGAQAEPSALPHPAAARSEPETPARPHQMPRTLDPRVYTASSAPSEPDSAPTERSHTAPQTSDGPDAGQPETKRVYRVAAVGDSLTDPESHGGKYLDYLRERCPHSRFDAYGKGGEMVNQMRRRFAEDVFGTPSDPKRPAYGQVIVFGGVNDLYSDLTAGRTVDKIGRDLLAMYSMARERGLEVTAITVSPWGGFERYYNERRGRATRQLNDWIQAQAASGPVDHVVDAYSLLSCGDPERLCERYAKPFRDGIHFGPAGHERLGRALFETVFSDCA